MNDDPLLAEAIRLSMMAEEGQTPGNVEEPK